LSAKASAPAARMKLFWLVYCARKRERLRPAHPVALEVGGIERGVLGGHPVRHRGDVELPLAVAGHAHGKGGRLSLGRRAGHRVVGRGEAPELAAHSHAHRADATLHVDAAAGDLSGGAAGRVLDAGHRLDGGLEGVDFRRRRERGARDGELRQPLALELAQHVGRDLVAHRPEVVAALGVVATLGGELELDELQRLGGGAREQHDAGLVAGLEGDQLVDAGGEAVEAEGAVGGGGRLGHRGARQLVGEDGDATERRGGRFLAGSLRAHFSAHTRLRRLRLDRPDRRRGDGGYEQGD